MRFKIVSLTTISNGLKQIISARNRLGRLQMVSELVTELCKALVGTELDPLHSRHFSRTRQSRRILKP